MGNEFLIECLLVFGCGQLPFAEKTQCLWRRSGKQWPRKIKIWSESGKTWEKERERAPTSLYR